MKLGKLRKYDEIEKIKRKRSGFYLGDSQHSAKQKPGEHVIVVGIIAQPHLHLN